MAPDDVFLLLINPPSKNKPVQKLIAKYVFDCYGAKIKTQKSLQLPTKLEKISGPAIKPPKNPRQNKRKEIESHLDAS